ncbi:hypothetical protein Q8A64_03810 [Oxalobacteraceae bacterium R-40]|uniref:Uncharacterized protein n=1 Tax=Keguizhuia sedimenti TaxID=3064264 RepID=A0ABU1BKM0_9BURK|nr:hypothetical protein [Oxalobacteraceae bacterium R-40]
MASTKNKRWNGSVDTLPSEFLKDVLAKMADYGDRVQFSRKSGPLPMYQTINSFDKKMAFDRNHHLARVEDDEFSESNASPVYTLEQVNMAIAGTRVSKEAKPKTVRVVRPGGTVTRTAAARLEDQFATARYEYFRNHRETLPSTISEHTEEITELMKKGKSVDDAFGEVIGKYY